MNAPEPQPLGGEQPPPLPPMREGLLDEATLARLFADLASCARVAEVLEKAGPQARASAGTNDLDAARTRLREGAVRSVQIRYVYEDRLWSDVILRVPGGYRVVRCLMPE